MAVTSYSCSLTQTVDLLGERWVFLIMREAFAGTTRFSDFRAKLGIASDVLSARLATLVEGGVMEQRQYREPGQRSRASYHLTQRGREFNVVLGALQQWGDRNIPSDEPRLEFETTSGRPATVRFVDEEGVAVESHTVSSRASDG